MVAGTTINLGENKKIAQVLAQGQQQLTQLMAQLIGNSNVVGNNDNRSHFGNRASTEGSNNHNPGPTVRTNTRGSKWRELQTLTPSIFKPQQQTTTQEAAEKNRLYDEYFRKYATLEDNT